MRHALFTDSPRRTNTKNTSARSKTLLLSTSTRTREHSAATRRVGSIWTTEMSTTRSKASGADQDASPKSPPLKGVYLLPDGRLMEKMPLSAVVSDAVRRWFAETEREANRGDVKAMALLGQMLMEGYGCDVDIDLGKKWADKARRRGYRMQRVYCEI